MDFAFEHFVQTTLEFVRLLQILIDTSILANIYNYVALLFIDEAYKWVKIKKSLNLIAVILKRNRVRTLYLMNFWFDIIACIEYFILCYRF